VSGYKLSLYAECWTKLRMWELDDEFDRLCYLDADMLVVRNPDHLFDLPGDFLAVPDCSFGRKTAAERDACPYFACNGNHYFNAGERC
jgi:alpha-N-acetylglucosamine transferase